MNKMNLPPFKLERYFGRYEFTAKHILCASDCESFSIGELLALESGAFERFSAHGLGYTETQGSPTLRKEISRLYETITPDDIIVHAGGEEGIFLVLNALLRPDDHVIVQTPCYQSMVEVAKGLGSAVTEWQERFSTEGWTADPDELRKAIRPETKAIIINNPHNPTGSQMTKKMFGEINLLAASRGIILFSDEAYRETEYRNEDRLPAACDVSETAISLGVMSKGYGLPGLRIAWLATRNAALREKISQLKDYTTICNSGPSEVLAEIALRNRSSILERNVGIMKKNLRLLEDFFLRHQDLFLWCPPSAGPIAFPRLLQGSIDQYCDTLVKDTGVLLLPGTIYDDPGNHFRIGFGRQNMPDALERWDAHLSARRG